ncbi:DUF4230 domain-containing protein [Saprospiraceae bacterium]|nr:DUF4230 domain-containing protein [Saprospiraceae bacterium]
MTKTLKYLAIILVVGFLVYGGYVFSTSNFLPKKHIITDSTVVLEKVSKVLKLVTVEGNFSEIHKHEEFYGYNISPLRKKALIRVNAKVLVGYDLEKMNIEIDEQNRTFYIDKFPEAEILSMDDEIEYYDISEGLFTSFSKEDYTSIQKEAEKIITKSVATSDLFERSNEQKDDMIALLELSLNSIGWKLNVMETPKKEILD